MQRKAPPQMPPQPAAAPVPERGLGLAVAHLRVVLEEGRRGGWPAWSTLAAELTMEDRTALAELVAVLTMVPPGAAPNPDAVAAHMGRLFPAVATQAGGSTDEDDGTDFEYLRDADHDTISFYAGVPWSIAGYMGGAGELEPAGLHVTAAGRGRVGQCVPRRSRAGSHRGGVPAAKDAEYRLGPPARRTDE